MSPDHCLANDLAVFWRASDEGGGSPGDGHGACDGARLVNAITFGTKRAFQGFLRVTRKPLAAMGLTAARFDVLWALLAVGRTEGSSVGVWQSELRKMLGVTAPVVTRMLQSLERLGLVRRHRELRGVDRRQVCVWLTDAGKECIQQARGVMIRAMRKLVFVAICSGQHRDPDKRLVHMDRLEGYLRSLRRKFGDRATLYYPWGCPDD